MDNFTGLLTAKPNGSEDVKGQVGRRHGRQAHHGARTSIGAFALINDGGSSSEKLYTLQKRI